MLTNPGNDLRRLCAASDVQDRRACHKSSLNIRVRSHHGDDHGDVHRRGNRCEVQVGDRRVEDDPHRALALYVLRQRYRANALRHAAAHTAEYISFGDNEEGFAGVDALEGNSLDVQRREGENADAVAQSLSEELNRPVIENATIGEDNLAALCVRDAALRDGVVKRAYVVTVKDGCLVVTVSNTYYAEEGDPVVEGGVAALEALLASFRLVDNEQ